MLFEYCNIKIYDHPELLQTYVMFTFLWHVRVTPTPSCVRFLPSERPTATSVTGCRPDDYVAENTTVHCTCSTGSVGKPAGRLQWVMGGASSPLATGDYGDTTLTLARTLQRADHDSTQFHCDVDWAGDLTGDSFGFKVGCKCMRFGHSVTYYWCCCSDFVLVLAIVAVCDFVIAVVTVIGLIVIDKYVTAFVS